MPSKTPLVHVEIFGQTYAVRAGGDPAYIERLAAYVDERMREVSRSSSAVDSLRIAVLAALNIADELHSARQQEGSAHGDLEARAEALIQQLDSVLDENG